MSVPLARSVAIAALIGVTMLASPLTTARAHAATDTAVQLAQAAAPQTPAAKGATKSRATKSKGETVEQRITKLHKALKITPDEEPNWNSVAQAMRENAANTDKLVAARRATTPQSMTALDDLRMYQEFTQAHADGLKNLIASFETLYNSMPDAQKKIADEVFRASRRRGAPSHH